jgi:hypothetical protein
MKFVVRKACEYWTEIDAESDEEAVAKADSTPVAEWYATWSPTEAEARPSQDTAAEMQFE